MERRPLKSRKLNIMNRLAALFAKMGISPNQISVASVFFALASGLLFYFSQERPMLMIAAAVAIQLRLLCNLMDGMVAIEYEKKTATGDLYNEIPDRLSDFLILAGAGYACKEIHAVELGYIAAFMAIFTAYVRVLGGSLGTIHYFSGPMAKPHRMALLTFCALPAPFFPEIPFIYGALLIIAVGSLITSIRRGRQVARELNQN